MKIYFYNVADTVLKLPHHTQFLDNSIFHLNGEPDIQNLCTANKQTRLHEWNKIIIQSSRYNSKSNVLSSNHRVEILKTDLLQGQEK